MRLAVGLSAALAGFATPAAAATEELLDCSTLAVTPAFGDKLPDAMLSGRKYNETDYELLAEMARVSRECVSRNGLSPGEVPAYFGYSIARLPRDALVVRLGKLGVSAQVIDDALDFGPGRSNPVISGRFSPQQTAALAEAFAARGLGPAVLTDTNRRLIRTYATATSLMWQALARLP